MHQLEKEQISLESERQEIQTKISDLEKQKESKNQILVKLREKEQELIATSGSSIGQLKEYDDDLRQTI